MQLLAVLLLLVILSACGALPAATPRPLPPPAFAGPASLWQDARILDEAGRLISAARRRVLVEMYEFGRRDLAALMRAASLRGLDVRLVYDPSVAESVTTAAALGAVGLAARAYPLDDRRHQIDHVKLLVADDLALVGGMNWGAASARNHDYAIETSEAAAVARLRAVFEQDWARAGGRLAAAVPPTSPSVMQTAPGREIRLRLLALLAAARVAVDAEVFALTDAEVLSALASARRRGVRVRVLLDPGQDVNRPSAGWLRGAGVEVRDYPVPPGAKLHAKAGLFDGRLLLGSANWSAAGLGINHELDVEADAPAITSAFAARFERDWAAAGGPWPWG